MTYPGFPKIPRWSREIVITEKIDGTNALIAIGTPDEPIHSNGEGVFIPSTHTRGHRWLFAGSKSRWITPDNDNHGFAKWAYDHAAELIELGPGVHHGEWWGNGIQRGYGLPNGDKRFSLFNVGRWTKWPAGLGDKMALPPACCHVVPILARCHGDGLNDAVAAALNELKVYGSRAAPFMDPEGIIIYHEAGRCCFKKTFDKDEKHKGEP